MAIVLMRQDKHLRQAVEQLCALSLLNPSEPF